MSRRLAAVAILLASCVSSRFRSLPRHEVDRFWRCRNAIVREQCRESGSTEMYEQICIDATAGRYADEPTERRRQRFLVEHGCPAGIAGLDYDDPSVPTANPPPPVAMATNCEGGRESSAATAGRCCWPGQSWDDAHGRCAGPPVCPDGMAAEGDGCTGTARPAPPPAPRDSPGGVTTTSSAPCPDGSRRRFSTERAGFVCGAL